MYNCTQTCTPALFMHTQNHCIRPLSTLLRLERCFFRDNPHCFLFECLLGEVPPLLCAFHCVCMVFHSIPHQAGVKDWTQEIQLPPSVFHRHCLLCLSCTHLFLTSSVLLIHVRVFDVVDCSYGVSQVKDLHCWT